MWEAGIVCIPPIIVLKKILDDDDDDDVLYVYEVSSQHILLMGDLQ